VKPLGVVNDDRHLTAEAVGVAVGHAEREQRGGRGIDGVSAILQSLDAGIDGSLTARGNGAMRARGFPNALGLLGEEGGCKGKDEEQWNDAHSGDDYWE
jgi:hypothetical protein